MEGGGGYDRFREEEEEEDAGCRTPTHEGSRIPVAAVECPPAPKRKRVYNKKVQKKISMHQIPKDGYFQHPDLDRLFKMMSTRRKPSYVKFQSCFERPPPGRACY